MIYMNNDIKIFISGSISIKKLDDNIIQRLNNIIEKGYIIIVGDAFGVDCLVQRFLLKKNYKNVIVYSTDYPRNNLGDWDNVEVESNEKVGTREYYTEKDKLLTEDCTYGFVIWDYKSKGTLNNIKRLQMINKRVLVYLNNKKEFLIK